jgi:hypothetical protein
MLRMEFFMLRTECVSILHASIGIIELSFSFSFVNCAKTIFV